MSKKLIVLCLVFASSKLFACEPVRYTKYRRATPVVYHRQTKPVVYGTSHTYVAPAVQYAVAKPATITRTEVTRVENIRVAKPVAVTRTKVELKTTVAVRAKSTVNVNGDFFGSSPGRAFVQFKNARMDAEIVDWTPRRVTLQLPDITATDGIEADLQVFTETGRLQKEIAILLKPALDPLEVVEELPLATVASK